MTKQEMWELMAYAMLDQTCYQQQRSNDLYIKASSETRALYDKFRSRFLDSIKNDKSKTPE